MTDLEIVGIGDSQPNLELLRRQHNKSLEEQIKYKYQSGEIWDWVTENIYVFGEPWDWEYSKMPINPGKFDRKNIKLIKKNDKYYLPKAPRLYLRQYVNERAPIKSCIKCRQSEFTQNEININQN